MKPITASTTLSILLHSAVFAAVLLIFEQAPTVPDGVGQGVEVELISAVSDSRHKQTDVLRRQELASATENRVLPDKIIAEEAVTGDANTETKQTSNAANRLLVLTSVETAAAADVFDEGLSEPMSDTGQYALSANDSDSAALITQSTSASQRQHSIIELLHRRISDNKKYPYLAKKQQREGVSTVAFMLYPDGSVENARLVHTSRSGLLDRAALSAVNKIEPFTAAQEYIEQAKEFQVDVVFNLL